MGGEGWEGPSVLKLSRGVSEDPALSAGWNQAHRFIPLCSGYMDSGRWDCWPLVHNLCPAPLVLTGLSLGLLPSLLLSLRSPLDGPSPVPAQIPGLGLL